MRRVLMGVLWFAVFFIASYMAACLVLAIYLSRQLPAGADSQRAVDIMQQFMSAHAPAVSAAIWTLVLVALFAAILGSLKGRLPGTKPKSQV